MVGPRPPLGGAAPRHPAEPSGPEDLGHRLLQFLRGPRGGFQDYWSLRYLVWRREEPLTTAPPYLVRYVPYPDKDPANAFVYGNARMFVTGRALPEMTIDAPVILPRLGPTTAAGGFADVTYEMSFLTRARWDALRARYPILPTWSFNDGYAAELRGTVTMDALGAEKILGLKGDPLAWWSANRLAAIDAWSTWLDGEGNDRFDVYSATRKPFAELVTDLNLTISGGLIVLTIVHAGWGIDALLARWLYWGSARYPVDPPAGILRIEGRYDRLVLRAVLGTTADVDLVTDVNLVLRAWAQTGTVGRGDAPAWVWQPTLLDSRLSNPEINPLSELDAYAGRTYVHLTPASAYYNGSLYYEYVPTGWDLRAGESLLIVAGLEPWTFLDPKTGAEIVARPRLAGSVPALEASWISSTGALLLAGPRTSGASTAPDAGRPWLEFGPSAAASPGGTPRRSP